MGMLASLPNGSVAAAWQVRFTGAVAPTSVSLASPRVSSSGKVNVVPYALPHSVIETQSTPNLLGNPDWHNYWPSARPCNPVPSQADELDG